MELTVAASIRHHKNNISVTNQRVNQVTQVKQRREEKQDKGRLAGDIDKEQRRDNQAGRT
ncbi:hypothetical protein VMCG_01752 [Cytospora schulzeri]|uniref:Uncharacterized protein n=1 Tax=Cytospora schulzeri TaxID=448051 RepID=A0A423X334_9PEZI|nr:hypothetical protein VMCG_01752 [Valsa malicola]